MEDEDKNERVELTSGDMKALLHAVGGGSSLASSAQQSTQQEPPVSKGPQNGDVRYVEKNGGYYKQTYRQGESDATTGWMGQVIQKKEYDLAQNGGQDNKGSQQMAGQPPISTPGQQPAPMQPPAAHQTSVQQPMNAQASSGTTPATGGTAFTDAAKAAGTFVAGESVIAKTAADTFSQGVQTAVTNANTIRNTAAVSAQTVGKQAADAVFSQGAEQLGKLKTAADTAWNKAGSMVERAIDGTSRGATFGEARNASRIASNLQAKAAQASVKANEFGNALNASARAAAKNASSPIIQQGATAAKTVLKSGINAAKLARVGSIAKGNAAFALAAGGAESGIRQGIDFFKSKKNMGATWGDVGSAVKDTFTTKKGWKNLGWGLLGSLKDVASTTTFGLVDNGDRLRENMQMDAKGGRSVQADDAPRKKKESTAPTDEQLTEVPEDEAASQEMVQGAPEEVPAPEQEGGGPRIVVNPEVFSDDRDALCVAMNEAFRVIMEMNGFDPVAEPTEAQRRFFADTAYSQDETMLRRTILARICTFDTSIS